jgi:hypothetical protein
MKRKHCIVLCWLFGDAFSTSTDRLIDKRRNGKNLERRGHSLKEVLSRHLLGETGVEHAKHEYGYSMTRSIFEPSTSQPQV